MLGGFVSGVTTGLLLDGSLVHRVTLPQKRDTPDGCDTAPAEAAAQTLRLRCPDGSMDIGIVNGRPGAARACGDGSVAGHAQRSRPFPAPSPGSSPEPSTHYKRWTSRACCRPPAWGLAALLPLRRHRCQRCSPNAPLTQKRSAMVRCVAVKDEGTQVSTAMSSSQRVCLD